MDGLSFRQVDEATGAEFDFPSPLCFTITAMNDDYEIIAFEKVVDCGIPSYKDKAKWIHFDKEEMALSIDAAENTRYGLVLALPRTIYNQVRGDIKGKLFDLGFSEIFQHLGIRGRCFAARALVEKQGQRNNKTDQHYYIYYNAA